MFLHFFIFLCCVFFIFYFFCMQGSSSWWTATTGRGWTRRGRNCPECLLRTNSETPCCLFLQINRWVCVSDTRRAKKGNEPQIYFSIGLDEKAFRYKDQDFICTGPFFNLKKKRKPLLIQRQKYKYQNGVNFHLKCFPVGDLYTLR